MSSFLDNSVINTFQIDESLKKRITLREIEEDDYEKNYFELLSNLTESPKPTKDAFVKRIKQINSSNNTKVYVLCLDNTKIISSITYIVEAKFIRGLGNVCHIEDFVVDKDYSKLKLGSSLCEFIKSKAKEDGCYKIILDCNSSVKDFYIKQGFSEKSLGMALYFN